MWPIEPGRRGRQLKTKRAIKSALSAIFADLSLKKCELRIGDRAADPEGGEIGTYHPDQETGGRGAPRTTPAVTPAPRCLSIDKFSRRGVVAVKLVEGVAS